MSKIGKKPIHIPAGVTIDIQNGKCTANGPLGQIVIVLHPAVDVKVEEGNIIVSLKKATKLTQPLWGTMASLIQGAVKGVTEGYQVELILQGIGFTAESTGNKITFKLGYAHPVVLDVPTGITAEAKKQRGFYAITIKGINKQEVGNFAGIIRKMKKADPYKIKGFRYVGEVVRKKQVKKTA